LGPAASSLREVDSSGTEEARSITQLQEQIQSDPQDTRSRLALANAYYQAGELETAWAHYQPAFQLFQILEKGSPDPEQQAMFASAYRNAAGILLTLDRPALAWDTIQDGIELHLKLLDFDDSRTTREGLRASYTLLSELSSRWPKDQRPNPIRSAIWPTDAMAFYDAVLELRTVRIILD
jgi:tetratricopeptide (TPR) repeat protein